MQNSFHLLCAAIFLAICFQCNAQVSVDGIPLHFSHGWAYQWSSNTWALQGRITPVYDANNRISAAHIQINVSGKWITVSRSTFDYNSGGQLIRQLDEDSSSTGWIGKDLYSLTYNTDGTVKTQLVCRINNGKWAPTFLNNYRYDANKKIIENFEQDRNNNAWENDDKYDYYYNNDGSLREILDSNWYGSYFAVDHRDTFNYINGAVHEKVHQDGNGKPANWVNVSKLVFDSAVTVGIEALAEKPLQANIFPNPTTGQAQISLPAGANTVQLSIFDITGRLLLSFPTGKTDIGCQNQFGYCHRTNNKTIGNRIKDTR